MRKFLHNLDLMARGTEATRSIAGARRPHIDRASLYLLRDEELLDLRFCDLPVSLEYSPLQGRIERLYEELARRDLTYRPYFWLSTEWFSPDGVPGIAIPFYLAHPRLVRLEHSQVLEVEGGTERWCLQLLRHETAHAFDSAYRLHRRRKWRDTFGRYTEPYQTYYRPKPYSRSYVLHLDHWYAQSHPAEDWAETFAVWLDPRSRWKKRYAGWPALKKLEYVDTLMRDIAGTKPLVASRERVEPLSRIKTTLREHYEDKKKRWGISHPEFYDHDLRRIFPPPPPGTRGRSAAAYLRRVRPELRRAVARWTGEYQYTIDRVLEEMVERCTELSLRYDGDDELVKQDAILALTVQTMNYLYAGHHRLAR